jgi:serine/threonine protein kinase
MSLHPTKRLQGGRFVLLGLLRAGGEAEVWRALETASGEERALKAYPAGEGGAETAARELSLARRLAHAHVVRVEDAFVEGDHAFVVMELAEGSLAERVATMGPLSPAEALAALEGPLAALAEAHAQGIVHRDVKPHNLLVFGDLGGALEAGGNATVKLADFGIAQLRAEGVTRTRSGALLGSLPFMSP